MDTASASQRPSTGDEKAIEEEKQKRQRGQASDEEEMEEGASPPEPKRRLPRANEPLFTRAREPRRLLGDGTPADAYRDLDVASWSGNQAKSRSNSTSSKDGSPPPEDPKT